MGVQARWQMTAAATLGALAMLLGSSFAAHADSGSVSPGQVIVVARDGSSLTVSGTGYTDCASQDVSVFLNFPERRDQLPPPGSPYRFLVQTPAEAQRFGETTVHVDAAGGFQAILLMPDITPARWHGYAVMAANCDPSGYRLLSEVFYAAPATVTALAELQTGIGALPPSASAVVIPLVTIDSVPGANNDVAGNYLLDHLTAYANGQRCAALNLKPLDARDAAGDAVLVIGTDDQPAACRERGAELTFTAWPQDVLLNFRTTVLPGIVQPIALTSFGTDIPMTRDSMQPAAAIIDATGDSERPGDTTPTVSAAGPTPIVAVDGTGIAPDETPSWPVAVGLVLLVLSIATVGIAKWKGRTR